MDRETDRAPLHAEALVRQSDTDRSHNKKLHQQADCKDEEPEGKRLVVGDFIVVAGRTYDLLDDFPPAFTKGRLLHRHPLGHPLAHSASHSLSQSLTQSISQSVTKSARE